MWLPETEPLIIATAGNGGAVRREGDGVQKIGVARQDLLQLTTHAIPQSQLQVTRSGDDHVTLRLKGNCAHPLGVAH